MASTIRKLVFGFVLVVASGRATAPSARQAELGRGERSGLLSIQPELPDLPFDNELQEGAATNENASTARSVSCGSVNRGTLHNAAELEISGSGFIIPEPWRSRGLRYGTKDMRDLLVYAAERVATEMPGGTLGVADISYPNGGQAAGHKSHQSGRDVDLLYYAIYPDGTPFAPDQHMAFFDGWGKATHAEAPLYAAKISERYFDLPRNWALVKAMISAPGIKVSKIFVSRQIRSWLLAYGQSLGEPESIMAVAESVLMRPRDSSAHNDHMHVRIACSEEDTLAGVCDEAPKRGRGRMNDCDAAVF